MTLDERVAEILAQIQSDMRRLNETRMLTDGMDPDEITAMQVFERDNWDQRRPEYAVAIRQALTELLRDSATL